MKYSDAKNLLLTEDGIYGIRRPRWDPQAMLVLGANDLLFYKEGDITSQLAWMETSPQNNAEDWEVLGTIDPPVTE